jgi:hypothetical protein
MLGGPRPLVTVSSLQASEQPIASTRVVWASTASVLWRGPAGDPPPRPLLSLSQTRGARRRIREATASTDAAEVRLQARHHASTRSGRIVRIRCGSPRQRNSRRTRIGRKGKKTWDGGRFGRSQAPGSARCRRPMTWITAAVAGTRPSSEMPRSTPHSRIFAVDCSRISPISDRYSRSFMVSASRLCFDFAADVNTDVLADLSSPFSNATWGPNPFSSLEIAKLRFWRGSRQEYLLARVRIMKKFHGHVVLIPKLLTSIHRLPSMAASGYRYRWRARGFALVAALSDG